MNKLIPLLIDNKHKRIGKYQYCTINAEIQFNIQ